MEKQMSLSELVARKMIEKLEKELGRLKMELTEAQVKNDLLSEALKEREDELVKLTSQYTPASEVELVD
jgi:septal ring factor EnvC (AmiA/AmiB activator)